MQKQNVIKKNVKHKKYKYLKMNLLTKYLHNNDKMYTLNNIVTQKRQQQKLYYCI